jgi:hypothetical protein
MNNGMKQLLALGRLGLLPAMLSVGCLSAPAGRIDIPSDLIRGTGDGNNGRGRYTVRVTDGDKDWTFTIPEIATAYEVRIPLRGGENLPGGGIPVDQPMITAADKEIVGQREVDARVRAEQPPPAEARGEGSREGEGDREADGETSPRPSRPRAARPAVATASTTGAPRTSYLLTLAKVKDLYRTRNYEIALVELVALEKQYPNDERIMSMKGSLYEKVGRRQLAREAWEAVLALNPYNLQVAEALQRLSK